MRFSTFPLYVSLTIPLVLTAAELGTGQAPASTVSTAVSVRDEVLRGRGYVAAGDYSSAELTLRAAIALPEDLNTQAAKIALADLLREEGRAAEAGVFYREVLQSEAIAPRRKFDALAGMADVDGSSGRMELAESEFEQAMTIARELKNISLEADAMRGLGMSWLDAENTSRAEPLLRRALKMMDEDPTPRPWAVASALVCLGRCYRMENKLALAEDVLTRGVALEQETYGPNHPRTAYAMERLAWIYSARNQFELARDYSSRALGIVRGAFGQNSVAMIAALINRASVEQQAGALAVAGENYAAALKIFDSNPAIRKQNPMFGVRVMDQYAAVLKATHRDRQAKQMNVLAKSLRSELK